MITRAFVRCNGGDYFTGEYCPFDGWSSPASKELANAVKRLARLNRRISLEELRMAGVSPATLSRTIIVQFGSDESVFDAISPQNLVVDGEAAPVWKLDQ